MKKILLSAISLSLGIIAHAGESVGEVKSTATMQSTCSIEAESINFGVVASPLMMQTANSEMNLKCSNATAYTVDLTYGGIYGQGQDINYTFAFSSSGSGGRAYRILNSEGVQVGSIACLTNGTVQFYTAETAKLYGATQTDKPISDKYGACTGSTPNPLSFSSSYDYGVMTGISKGDSLAYSIAVPGDSNKVWNKGKNSYSSTGNGDIQTISMNAKIVPDKSASKYPAPDMYLDTVTAIISY